MTKLALDTLVLRKLEPGPDTVSSLARMLQAEPERVKAALYRLVRAMLVEESAPHGQERLRSDLWRSLDQLRNPADSRRRFYQLTRAGERLPDDAVRSRYRAVGGRWEDSAGGVHWTGVMLPGDMP